MGLKELPIKISYKSQDKDNILDSFLIPALRSSVIYKRSVGFFSSSVFELIGAGLETLIENDGHIQIICSPEISKDDLEAIKLGYKMKMDVIKQVFHEDIEEVLENLENNNLKLLAELISIDKLNIKLVDPSQGKGMYHDKIGILEDAYGDKVLFVGSANESKSAYLENYEKIRVSVSWNPWDLDRIEDDEDEFNSIWNENNDYIKTVDYTDVVGKKIFSFCEKKGIHISAGKKKNEKEDFNGVVLRPYQTTAINKWLENNCRGFFVMATGTGKTWTAIYAAMEVAKKENLFLVICAPYKHLVRQWFSDIKNVFGDCTTVLVTGENTKWEDELKDAILNSKYNNGGTVIAISTIVSFNSERFMKVAKKTQLKRMLIVDEAHRFKNLSEEIKQMYPYMLGLSATPSNKKNEDSAKELLDYFGGKVFDLPIEYAIDKGYLVHYNYYPIFVNATIEEEEKYEFYTNMMMSCFRNNICIDLEGLSKYKRARLRVISMAQEKIEKIDWILSYIKEEDHFIIYCGDGKLFGQGSEDGKRHIRFIKEILDAKGYRVNQFTAEENMKTRMQIVNAFNKGMIDSMVAIRCLDEGINIPSIKGALLLSSNDDYREFVQRRGRILRTYTDVYSGEEKEIANIYDVIVLPNDNMRGFALIELRRFYEYARLADNRDECLCELEDLYVQYGLTMEEVMDVEFNEDELDE